MPKYKSTTGTSRQQVLRLSPTTTATLADGIEGSLAYDSTTDQLKVYGTSWLAVTSGTGSGGTETTMTGYKIHTFTSDGDFVVSGGAVEIDILLVGGGGGSVGDNGGGGGAGGLVWTTGYALTVGTYAIDVGAGGVGGTAGQTNGVGADTTFASTTFVAKGGGYAGAGGTNAGAGGSGGGAGRNNTQSSPGATIQSSGGTAQGGLSVGYIGGISYGTSNSGPGGGGGGAGGAGVAGTQAAVGDGGVGHSSFLTDTATTSAFLFAADVGTSANQATTASLGSDPGTLYIAGGGSAGTQDRSAHPSGGLGGLGGGANYGGSTGTAGQANTGGGGSGTNSGGGTGGAGGSGVVVIRYVS